MSGVSPIAMSPPLPASSLRTLAEPLYLDIYPLLAKQLTGIGRFVARLVESLAQLTPLRLITTIGGKRARSVNLSALMECGQEIPLTSSDLPQADDDVVTWVRQLFRRPRYRHDGRRAKRCPGVFTSLRPGEKHFGRELGIFYDFTPLVLPWAHTADTRKQYGTFFAQHCRLCDKALAISAATKADADWLCALSPEDVAVGYPGPSLCVHQHAHAESVARSSHMILVVSTLEPRKNARFLLDWFARTEVLGSNAELCWVGPTGWLWEGFADQFRKKAWPRAVRFMGTVSDHELCALYRQAACTVYPSLYEGFGFPVLDALRHGAPVLCSLNSSLLEFAGPGVFYFDPYDPGTLDRAYEDMIAARPIMISQETLDQRFSWNALARTVIDLCA